MVMVGLGTGIAPIRSFLQARARPRARAPCDVAMRSVRGCAQVDPHCPRIQSRAHPGGEGEKYGEKGDGGYRVRVHPGKTKRSMLGAKARPPNLHVPPRCCCRPRGSCLP